MKGGTLFIQVRVRTSGGLCEHDNEPLDPIKRGKFGDKLRD